MQLEDLLLLEEPQKKCPFHAVLPWSFNSGMTIHCTCNAQYAYFFLTPFWKAIHNLQWGSEAQQKKRRATAVLRCGQSSWGKGKWKGCRKAESAIALHSLFPVPFHEDGELVCTACILGNARNGFPFAENIYHWLCLWKNRAENVIEPANHQYLGLQGRAEDLRGRTRLLSCFPAWLLAGWWRGAKWLWFDVCLLAHPSLGAQ